MLAIKLMPALLLLLAPTVSSYCSSRTYSAYTYRSYISHQYYNSYEDCTFTIIPSRNFNGHSKHGLKTVYDYFLELKWESFDVKGNMPDCESDYAEVSLTRSNKALGKFCSSNLVGSSLFTMYSYDGYAKIKFHSDGSNNGNGFRVSYILRSRTSSSLSGFGYCSWSNMYSSSDNFYTSDWPNEYSKYGSCDYKINTDGTKKLYFMDLDVRKPISLYCSKYSTNDYVMIKGGGSSTYGYNDATELKGPICRTTKIVTFTTSYDKVFVRLNKKDFSSSDNRGLVAGYLSYKTKSNTGTAAVIIGISVAAGIAIILVVSITTCCICKRNRIARQQRQPIYTTSQPAGTTGYGNVYHASTQPQPQNAAYPTVSMYPGMNDMPPPYSAAMAKPYQQGPHQSVPVSSGYQPPPATNPAFQGPDGSQPQPN